MKACPSVLIIDVSEIQWPCMHGHGLKHLAGRVPIAIAIVMIPAMGVSNFGGTLLFLNEGILYPPGIKSPVT